MAALERVAVFLFVLFLFGLTTVSAGQIEHTPPAISLRDVLPESFINSANYRVNILGVNKGRYQFLVESDLGNYKVDSTALLLKRLKEIDVMAQVSNQVDEDFDPYANGLQSELRIQSDSPVDLLSSPLSTASNFAGQLADNLGDTLDGEGSIYEYAAEVGGAESSSQDPIHAMHKRNAASQLDLDVYSRNVQLQLFLNRLASLRSAGEISAGAKLINTSEADEFSIASGEIDRKIKNTVRKYNQEELLFEQQNLLSSLKINEGMQKDFLGNQNISPSIKTAILFYLDFLRNVNGLPEVITLASILDNPVSAQSFLQLVKMVALYHERIAKISEINSTGTMLSANTRNDRLLHFYTDDLFMLTEKHKTMIKRIAKLSGNKKYSRSEIIFYGDLSDQTRFELLDNNIDYREFFLRRL